MNSNLVIENQEYIIEAINKGIDSDTVNSTLENVANYSESPKQILKVVTTIANMKNDKQITRNDNYLSETIKLHENSIRKALNEGVSAIEISNTLIQKLDENSKQDLKFVVSLISKMKQKELSKKNNKQYIYQK